MSNCVARNNDVHQPLLAAAAAAYIMRLPFRSPLCACVDGAERWDPLISAAGGTAGLSQPVPLPHRQVSRNLSRRRRRFGSYANAPASPVCAFIFVSRPPSPFYARTCTLKFVFL